MGNQIPEDCGVHSHIVLGTTLRKEYLEYYIQTIFKNSNTYIEDITKRNDTENYVNYLLKQKDILTINKYNYKIEL